MNNVEQAIWWKDVNSVYLGCNRKLAEYGGVADPTELIGKSDADCPWGSVEVDRQRRKEGEKRGATFADRARPEVPRPP